MSNSHSKLAFIGGEENTLCFRGMGFDVYSANSLDKLKHYLPELRRNEYSLILVEWRYYNQVKEHFADRRSEALPVILGIPTRTDEMGRGSSFMRKLVVQAIGSDRMLRGEE